MVNDNDLPAHPDEPQKMEQTIIESPQEQNDIEAERERLLNIAEQAQKEKKIEIQRLSEEALIIVLLMKIPVISDILNQLKTLSTSVFALATLNPTTKAIPLSPALQSSSVLSGAYTNLGLINSIINFFTLPMVFLASRLLKKPSPVTLTTFGEWVYSGVILGLTIAAMAAPISAPIIGAVLASIGLGYSFYLLAKFSSGKKALQRAIPLLEQEIQSLNHVLDEQKKIMADLQSKLQSASAKELEQYDLQITQCSEKIENTYQALSDKMSAKEQSKQKLKAYTDADLLDCSVGIGVASAFVVATVVSFIFPPVGFTMMTTAALIGAGYTIGRLAVSGFTALYERFHTNKEEVTPEQPTSDEEVTSTAKIISGLEDTCSLVNDDKVEAEKAIEEEQDPVVSFVSNDDQETVDGEEEPDDDIDQPKGPHS